MAEEGKPAPTGPQQGADERLRGGLKPRRPWHAPNFSTLKVAETEQWDDDHHHHCWDRWKCS